MYYLLQISVSLFSNYIWINSWWTKGHEKKTQHARLTNFLRSVMTAIFEKNTLGPSGVLISLIVSHVISSELNWAWFTVSTVSSLHMRLAKMRWVNAFYFANTAAKMTSLRSVHRYLHSSSISKPTLVDGRVFCCRSRHTWMPPHK